MAPSKLQVILCCSSLKSLPTDSRSTSTPPTADSARHLDFLCQQSGQLPRQDNSQLPLTLENYHQGVISVVRTGDITEEHWPTSWYAAWANDDQTLRGFIEIQKAKVDWAEFEGILENSMLPKIECYYGQCPNHPNLEFYAQYPPLRLKPQWRDPSVKIEKSEHDESKASIQPALQHLLPYLHNHGGSNIAAATMILAFGGETLQPAQLQKTLSSPDRSQSSTSQPEPQTTEVTKFKDDRSDESNSNIQPAPQDQAGSSIIVAVPNQGGEGLPNQSLLRIPPIFQPTTKNLGGSSNNTGVSSHVNEGLSTQPQPATTTVAAAPISEGESINRDPAIATQTQFKEEKLEWKPKFEFDDFDEWGYPHVE